MKAMIFAAGLGTRLKPITDTLPKALVPICGKPLLQHVLEKLEAAGIDDFVVNVHHFADKIEAWVAEHPQQARVAFSDERDLLRETGGGIMHARPLLEDAAHFLVHNVDILSDLDLGRFMAEARPEALATLVVSARKTKRYLLFDSGMRLVGWTNIETGQVRSPYPDLDVKSCRMLAFSGVHYISNAIFPLMEGWGEKFSIIDFYLSVCAEHPVYGWVPEQLKMIDDGKIGTLDQAEALCRSL